MTYDEAIEWLLSFADFERSGRFQDRPDVAPMLALLERLGNPHLGRTTVHIAGSKGKGSVAAMVNAMLAVNAGFETGRYTSPHLYSYCERIWLSQCDIEEDNFALLVQEVLHPAVKGELASGSNRQLVTFDLLTALAFIAFREWQAQIQILEVGLGGRVDSTNVFASKDLAVITPISLEHTAILGDAIQEIASEKAAIITTGCTVVMAPQAHDDARRVTRKFAERARAPVIDVAEAYRWKKLDHDLKRQSVRIEGAQRAIDVRLPLLGAHQLENAATALASIDVLNEQGYEVSDQAARLGLRFVQWPCRIEVVREGPLVVVDGAHNRDSARRLAETLVEYFACDRALFVIGCSSDKDIDGLAEELARLASRVIAVRAEHPRAMAPERIVEAFGRLNVDCENVDSVAGAMERAIAATAEGGLICVAGSLFVAAEARAHVLGVKSV